MSLIQHSITSSNCTARAIPLPAVFGASFLSLNASLVENFSYEASSYYNFNHGDITVSNATFCNITITHTHPGQDDILTTKVWLPVRPAWNERLQAVGGGGWVAGLFPFTDIEMAGAIGEGYATVTTNAGLPSQDPADWALLSPGNVNTYLVQDLAAVSLNDAALIAKSVINSFYGQPVKYSYWSGCSQGGRQGLTFAQRYPDVFDGIAASAPAINWGKIFVSEYFPQQVMNEMGIYPHPCELDALTAAAIKACDGNDGLIDGIISDPDSCTFDPQSAVGTPLNCSTPGAPSNISQTAATVASAAWNGAKGADGNFLWYTPGYEANLTSSTSVAQTACSANGTCTAVGLSLLTDWIRLFVEKDKEFDTANMTRDKFEQVFKKSAREYRSTLDTNSPDLSEFRKTGGKMIGYHGLADQIIAFRNSRAYYDAVTALDPDVHDFYRLFEAPGLGHCTLGVGGYPSETFHALVDWVENGVVPDELRAVNSRNVTTKLCPYPMKAKYVGEGESVGFESFECV